MEGRINHNIQRGTRLKV